MRSIVVLLLVALAGCHGRAVAHGGPPRIVSLMPTGTEVVAALGAGDELVGVDTFSTYPPRVAHLPKVGTYLQPSEEDIVRLAPTLVVVDDVHGAAAATLRRAGIDTVACSIKSLPDVERALRDVGAKLGRTAQAEAAIAAMQASLARAAAHRMARHPRVLAVIDREAGGLANLVAAGPGSYVDELLRALGADNALAGASLAYPTVSQEEVIESRPDVIVDLSSSPDGIAAWQALDVPAVRAHRVVALGAKDAPYLVAPSPRVGLALDALAKAIY